MRRDEATFARTGLPALSRKKHFPESHMINPLLTKLVRSRWLDIGLVLFCVFMDLDSVSVHKHAKKELGQYPAILTSQLVHNPYILPVRIANHNAGICFIGGSHIFFLTSARSVLEKYLSGSFFLQVHRPSRRRGP